MNVESIYWRRDKGPVQESRVWDRARFIEARVNESTSSKKPDDHWVFALATADQYKAQRAEKRA